MTNQLNDLQKYLLNMLSEIAPLLEKNNFNYYVVAGTLLGAVRHKGFIPWDDDLDISLPRHEYERLLKTANQFLPSQYKLETYSMDSEYPYLFAKIYDQRTTLIEGLSQPLVRGIYIDIFPLDGITENLKEQKSLTTKLRKYLRIYRRFMSNPNYNGNLINKGTHNLISPLVKFFFPKHKLIERINNIIKKKSWESSTYITNFFGSWKEKEIHKKEWYQNRISLDFNGVKVFAPEKYHEVLTCMYGDYKKLPAENRRVSHHNFSYLNLNEPYKSYKNRC